MGWGLKNKQKTKKKLGKMNPNNTDLGKLGNGQNMSEDREVI